jgi:hypothetical protein
MWLIKLGDEVFQGPFKTITEAAKIGHSLHVKWGFQWELAFLLEPNVDVGEFVNARQGTAKDSGADKEADILGKARSGGQSKPKPKDTARKAASTISRQNKSHKG